MIGKIISFIKNLLSEENVKTNRSRIEKIESVLEPIIKKEEVVEEPTEEKVVKKPRKQPTKKTTSARKKKED